MRTFSCLRSVFDSISHPWLAVCEDSISWCAIHHSSNQLFGFSFSVSKALCAGGGKWDDRSCTALQIEPAQSNICDAQCSIRPKFSISRHTSTCWIISRHYRIDWFIYVLIDWINRSAKSLGEGKRIRAEISTSKPMIWYFTCWLIIMLINSHFCLDWSSPWNI